MRGWPGALTDRVLAAAVVDGGRMLELPMKRCFFDQAG